MTVADVPDRSLPIMPDLGGKPEVSLYGSCESIPSAVRYSCADTPMPDVSEVRIQRRVCVHSGAVNVWLLVLPKGVGLVDPPIGKRFGTVVFFWSGEILCIWVVYTWRESFGVLQMTGSLLHVVVAGRLTDLSNCLTCLCLRVPRFSAAASLCLNCIVYV